MICPSCQVVNEADARFCKFCGNRFFVLVQTMTVSGYSLFSPWRGAWSQLFELFRTEEEFIERINKPDMQATMSGLPEAFMGKVQLVARLDDGVEYSVLEWYPIIFNAVDERWELDAEVLPNPGTILTTNLE